MWGRKGRKKKEKRRRWSERGRKKRERRANKRGEEKE